MVFDDKYFTSTDTSTYFTLVDQEKMKPSDLYSSVVLGESFHPSKTPLQGVNEAINHGLPSVMITMSEANLQARGDQALASGMDKLSKVQQNAIGELINVNKTNFVMHAPVVDIMGLGGAEHQRSVISGQTRQEHFEMLKASVAQTDNIAKKADIKNPVICFHASNMGASGVPFDSGLRDENQKPIYGVRAWMVNQDTGELLPADTQFLRLPVGSYREKGYTEIKDTYDEKQGTAIFAITPKLSIDSQNNTALNTLQKEVGDLIIKRKQLEDMKKAEASSSVLAQIDAGIKDMTTTIGMNERRIQHLVSRFGQPDSFRQFVSIEDFSNSIVPEQVAKLALAAFKSDTQPVLALENEPGWQFGGDPEKVANWVDLSREKFTEMLMKEEHMSKDEAKRKSEELIGITFDTGHLNTLKQQINPNPLTGKKWTNEELQEQVKMLSKKGVKTVHLADNMGEFGVDSHLIIGRGDTQIDEFMKILRENGFKGTAQIEAFTGEFGTESKMPAFTNIMGLGAPLYTMYGSPSARDVGLDFSSPYSMRNINYSHQIPALHWSTWGGPFAGLQSTFGAGGGQQQKDQFTETPTE